MNTNTKRTIAWAAGLAASAILAGTVAAAATPTASKPEAAEPKVTASAPSTPTVNLQQLEHEANRPIRLAVVGASITAWSPPFAGDTAQSWVMTATSNELPLVGGWALPGAKLGEMAAAVTPAPLADYLVIMGGTNDMYYQVPIAERWAAIDAIAATIGAPRVVIAAVAPYDPDPQLATDWNASLQQLAAERGWLYIDPWTSMGIRAGDRYATGADFGDGVHPSPASAAAIGASIRVSLTDAWAAEH